MTIGTQEEMFFDGHTYVHSRDSVRLGRQHLLLRDYMEGRGYVSLQEISDATGIPQASASAGLRDFRKVRFGGRTVSRVYISNGLHKYKLEEET
jgi:hypothetical protein